MEKGRKQVKWTRKRKWEK